MGRLLSVRPSPAHYELWCLLVNIFTSFFSGAFHSSFRLEFLLFIPVLPCIRLCRVKYIQPGKSNISKNRIVENKSNGALVRYGSRR